MGDLEVSECPRSLGVDHALRDPLPVEVGDDVHKIGVLKQDGTTGASRLAVVVVIDGAAERSGRPTAILQTEDLFLHYFPDFYSFILANLRHL